MLSQRELDLITNSLANLYDWDSEDIQKDFITLLKNEVTSIQEKDIEYLFVAFDRLPAKEKMSPHFNFQEFIKKNLDF